MILNNETKYKGYLSVDEITYKNRSGKSVKREVMRRHNAVAALVFNTDTEKYIFTSQWRSGVGDWILEIPAGTLDKPGEDLREAISREIEEEVGYAVDKLTLIDEGFVSPGGNSEMVSIYFAEVSQRISEGGGVADENEEIDVVEMDKNEMLSTRFKDLKTIIAVQWAKYNR